MTHDNADDGISTSRRSYLKGLGVLAAAGTGTLAGCADSVGGGGFNVEDEFRVVPGSEYGWEQDGYAVHPTDWSKYYDPDHENFTGVKYRVGRENRPVTTDGMDMPEWKRTSLYAQIGTAAGKVYVDDDQIAPWTPTATLDGDYVPFVFDTLYLDRPTELRIGVDHVEDVEEGEITIDTHMAAMKDDWYQEYAEDDRLLLGAIPTRELLDDRGDGFGVQFNEKGGDGLTHVWWSTPKLTEALLNRGY